ncbi:hypothetical protein ZYGR_0N01720 [Zygosaccharomyces rouxii]|uniref:ZYRO0D04312p n=2 Tax=Zygosaccharomyces rouxii TaxID=4956 RepID=C5DV68_ZYGRC|nr:uncharacterized protein ZYRO0D04312g [Zygosaccharomyces rouxii]KAH9200601.1 hypothetical protein LQ764DRAFT_233881 [Zygosaccharomyces rouxii]GAV48767.1 hypothetical protein ZYGR_0N01720 [Zygosaccharomyces rouxii]CAR27687.1 ZYRO0D04312p [Zygosaccharomyces rouxii]
MFAVAAAHATRLAKVKGAQHLDIYDVRIIQYRSAILRLSEAIRLLEVLEKNLEKRQDAGKTIIPLINYVLSLCEGPVFNIHPVLRKRFTLLSEFKLTKLNEVNPPLSPFGVEYDVDFAPFVVDLSQLRENVYNSNLQWKLMGCLQAISQNALDIYEKKLKHVSMERASKRPADFPGKVLPLNYGAIDDILRPFEMELCLDWAVLINDREQDTSFKSLRKLQSQVLTKFLSNINEKVFPVIRTYFNQLQKAYNNRSPAVANLKELPHWEFSVHRLYSYIYRIICVLDVMVNLTRQLWLPNRDYFYSLRSQLSSENVYAYNEILDKIDSICNEPKRHVTGTILAILDSCSNPNLNISVTANTVPEIFANSICKVTPILRNTLQSITSWLEVWKFVDNNHDSHEKLASLNEEQLSNMLQERLAVDKLNQAEMQQRTNRLSPDVTPSAAGGLSRTGSTIRRSHSKRLSTPTSPSTSSNISSPGKVSPLKMSPANSVDKPSARGPNISSPQLSRRSSIVDIRISSPTSHSGSPQISGKNSLADSRVAGSVPMKNAGDQKCTPRSPLANRTANGRPRSSSLQSGHDEDTNTNRKVALPSRSTSLQAHATVNQKRIQDSFAQLTRSRSINGSSNISGSPNGRKMQQTTRKTRTPTLTGNPPTSSRQGFKSTSETSPLPEMEELSIGSGGGHERKRQHEEQNGEESSPNGLSSPQKRTQQQQEQETPSGDKQQEKEQPQGQQEEKHGQQLPYEHHKYFDHKVADEQNGLPLIKKPEESGQEPLEKEESEEREQSAEPQQARSEQSSYHGAESMSAQEADDAHSVQKKVRFAGVGPMTEDELTRPTRRGWYRKPAVLHYPPPPPQYLSQKFRLRQEGMAFRTSLREENGKEPTNKRNSMVTTFDELAPPPQKESVSHRFASILREKLK